MSPSRSPRTSINGSGSYEERRQEVKQHLSAGEALEDVIVRKLEEQIDEKTLNKVRKWMEGVLGESLGSGGGSEIKFDNGNSSGPPTGFNFLEGLRDGVLLCRVMNKLRPGLIENINLSSIPEKQIKNLTRYRQACLDYGLTSEAVFQDPKVFHELTDVCSVIAHLWALAQFAITQPNYTGPSLRKAFSSSKRGLRGKSNSRIHHETFAHQAVRAGDLDCLKKHLKSDPTKLTTKNSLGQNLLHAAALEGQLHILTWLLDNYKIGPLGSENQGLQRISNALNPNANNSFSQFSASPSYSFLSSPSPTSHSSSSLSTSLSSLEAKYQLDIDAKDRDEFTVLHYFARFPWQGAASEKVLNALIRRGATIEAQNKYGETPLQLATSSLQQETILALLNFNADVNARNM